MEQRAVKLPRELDERITAVKQIIEEQIKVSDPQLQAALRVMASNGGKFLRPLLFFICAQIGGTPRKQEMQLRKIAASLEILHMATLVHDDIIDDSPLRRGAISVQSRFGKDVAVYAGDLLFTIFFDLTLDEMADTPYLKINATALKEILNGELGQMYARYDAKQPLQTYLDNASKKTAWLFKLACMEGAYFGGANEQEVAQAAEIGKLIGLSFQMLDDVLDYSLENKDANKPVLEDLATGVYSLPLLLALKNEQTGQLEEILAKRQALTPKDFQEITRLVIENDGVKEARRLAKDYSQQALDQISMLPIGKAKKQLDYLTRKLLQRTI